MTSTVAPSFVRSLLASSVAGATVWLCLLAWRPLVERPGDYLVPLLLSAAVMALVGATARWRGVGLLATSSLQLLVAVTLALLWTTGSPWPTPAGIDEFVRAVSRAGASANRYAAPVPAEVPSVAPLFLTAGLGALWLVDLVALSGRRVAAVGLVLLVLHLVPVNLGVAIEWWLFVLVAAGFLVLLFGQQDDRVVRWGEEIDSRGSTAGATDAGTTDVGTGDVAASGATALKIGVAAVVGALALTTVLSTVVPQPPTRQWAGGAKGPDTGEVSLTSPLVDMRRDLVRGLDMPLLQVDGVRQPTYVRTAVLASFNGNQWSTGDRKASRVQAATGTPLKLTGVDPLVRRTETEYTFRATDQFRSRWLPTMPVSSSVRAEGDWRYDQVTTDFASYDEGLSTSGLGWDVVGVELDHSATALDRAPSGLSQVDRSFTDLPRSLPARVEELAEEVVGEEPTRFRQARALQDWFRSEFTYSLEQAQPVGTDELLAFLDESGREGYCEQFAAAMAVMARTLGIPSRVAVGFLVPDQVGPDQWEFSSHDLHAWPELYFAGAGWVRFEPTPASRASGVPDYSVAPVDPIPGPTAAPTPSASPSASAPAPRERADEPAATEEETGTGVDLGRLVGALLALVLLAAVVLAPQWVRGRRRSRRLASGSAEELWAELRDSSVDLGLDWPTGRSPRVQGTQVSQWSAPDDSSDLRLLVEAVEEERFASPERRRGTERTQLAGVVTAVVSTLGSRAPRAARWRARWVPRSLAPGRRNRSGSQ